MKKILILAFLITNISTIGIAQIDRKTMILGGNASMIVSTSGNSFFNFNPCAGFFLNDKICIGASASVILLNEDFYWGAGSFTRYYFTPDKTQSVFTMASLGLSNLNSNSVGFSAGVGNVWFINKNVGFETELIGSTNFENFSAGMYLGFQIYYNRKQN